MLEVTYSYWDGSGHRRVLKCKKGTTIAKFLEMVKAQVAVEFTELRAISADDLVYIKEDLIIPHVRPCPCLCAFARSLVCAFLRVLTHTTYLPPPTPELLLL